jgi:hypothetical protein
MMTRVEPIELFVRLPEMNMQDWQNNSQIEF